MRKIYFVFFLLLISMQFALSQTTDKIKESEKWKIVNVNPDPNGDPWIAGGLRPLTKAEELKMLNTPRMLIKREQPGMFKRFMNLISGELPGIGSSGGPSKVNNAALPAFRPIFSQVGNCCGQASGVAYNYTYEWNLANGGTSATTPETQFPSHYTWNFLNDGEDLGSWYFDGWDYIIENGVPTIKDFGSIDAGGDNTFWMSGYDKYKEAMLNRVVEYKTIQVNTWDGINTLRRWMQDHNRGDRHGGLANFSALSAGYKKVTAPVGTEDAGAHIITSWGNGGAHAITMVGYNDNICFDYNGDGKYTNNIDINNDGKVDLEDCEKGAFIMANSWGDYWADKGFCYVMYNVCARNEAHGGLQNHNLVHIIDITKKQKQEIKYSLKAKMVHSNRGSIKLSIGYNPDFTADKPSEDKIYEFNMFNMDGGEHALCGDAFPSSEPFEFGLDMTDLQKWFSQSRRGKFFLIIDSEAGKGKLSSASIVDDYYSTEHRAQVTSLDINIGRTIVPINMFNGQEAHMQADNIAVSESKENDGEILNKVNFTLVNTTFKKLGNLVENTDYTLENLPEGLKANLKITSNAAMILSFTGKANYHENVNSSTLKININESVFSNTNVIDGSPKIAINFIDEYRLKYFDIEDVIVSTDNPWELIKTDIAGINFGAWRTDLVDGCNFKLEPYNSPIVCNNGTGNITPIAYGSIIGGESNWYTYDEFPNQPTIDSDNFKDWRGKDAYIGFKLTNLDDVYFGWFHCEVNNDASEFKLMEYAYFTKPNTPIPAGMSCETSLQFPNYVFNEDRINNKGGIQDEIVAKLFNTNFTVSPNTILDNTYCTVSGLPDGLTARVKVLENNNLEVRLKGRAVNHTKIDKTDFHISFTDALFQDNTAAEVKNTESNFEIIFRDEYKIIYQNIVDVVCDKDNEWNSIYLGDVAYGSWLDRGSLRFETYTKAAICQPNTNYVKPLEKGTVVDLNSKGWFGGEGVDNILYIHSEVYKEWAGKDAYLAMEVIIDGYVSYGWMHLIVSQDGTSYTVTEWAYNEQPLAPITVGETTAHNEVLVVVKNPNFVEPYSNDGSLEGNASVNIVNEEYVVDEGEYLTENTHYKISNVPAGISCKIKVNSKSELKIELTGNADNHLAYKNSEIKISLLDALFYETKASDIQNSDFVLPYKFKEPWDIVYRDIIDININEENVWRLFNLPIGDEGFGSWFFSTESLKVETYGNRTICFDGTSNLKPLKVGSIIGNESNTWHEVTEYGTQPNLWAADFKDWEGKEAYFGFALVNGDYLHYGWMKAEVNADGTNAIIKEWAFNDEPFAPIIAGDQITEDKPVLEYSLEPFIEDFTNNGSIYGEAKFNVFAGNFALNEGETYIEETHYSVNNLPDGLKLKLTQATSDTLVVEITGNALDHNANSDGKFTLTFKPSLFKKGVEAKNSVHSFDLKFRNEFKVVYKDIDDVLCSRDHNWTAIDFIPDVAEIGAWCNTDNWVDFLKLELYDSRAICEDASLNLKFIDAGVIVGPTSKGWKSYDEYPNEHDVSSLARTNVHGKTGYVAIESSKRNFKFYSWIQIQVAEDGLSYKILDFAYNENPDTPIVTGSKISVPVAPMVNFKTDLLEINIGESIQFIDLSDYQPTAWEWTFNGGEPDKSAKQNPKVKYNVAGVYDVSLKATNEDGSNSLTKQAFIRVINPSKPVSDFGISQNEILVGMQVDFYDKSLNMPQNWEWTFEGGEPKSSNSQNPSVTYAKTGEYSVKLIVKNQFGEDQVIRENIIKVIDNNGYCEASSNGETLSIVSVKFADIDNQSVKGSVYSDFTEYQADLKKNNSYLLEVKVSDVWSRNGFGVWIDWNGDNDFEDEGEQLKATEEEGGSSFSLTVKVPEDARSGITRMRIRTSYYGMPVACGEMPNAGEVEDYSIFIEPLKPEANFSVSKKQVVVGESVILADMSLNSPNKWEWTIEGANPSTSDKQHVNISYDTPGTYNVKLVVSNGKFSDTKILENYITVTEQMEVSKPMFITNTTEVNSGETVHFMNTTQYNKDYTYEWTFEGGEPNHSTDMSPNIVYSKQGIYSVSLKVKLGELEKNIIKEALISVKEHFAPVVDFRSSITSVLEGNSIQFTDLSVNEPTRWEWTFEGGQPAISTDQNPIVSFANSGVYSVSLKVSNKLGGNYVMKEGFITVNKFSGSGYCEAKNVPKEDQDNWLPITRVSLAEINNPSVLSEYSDFTDQCANLVFGKEYPMNIEFGNTWENNTISVWIDWDQNKQFEDSERIIYEFDSDENGKESFILKVPESAKEGYTVMRIRSNYSVACKPCGIITYVGEVEDYAIHVVKEVKQYVNFVASNIEIQQKGSIVFSNKSDECDSYLWEFEGGVPEISTDKNPIIKYNEAGTFSVKLTTTNNGVSVTENKESYITVTETVNNAPTGIELSKNSVAEDAGFETVIGTLLAIDADENDTHTFELVTDVADNASFTIDGTSLKLNTALDFERKETYSIKVKVTDAAGLNFEKVLTIQVTEVVETVNNAPTDVELSNAEVAEDASLETVIGTLLAIDADENDTHTFELVTDVADNASFTIEGASLKLNTALDFETKETYSIKVKVTDAAGLNFEKVLTIQVTDVDETVNNAPTDIELSNAEVAEDASIGDLIGTLSATDADENDTHTFTFADGGTDNASFTIDGTNLILKKALNFETQKVYKISVNVTDKAKASFKKEFKINVTKVDETVNNAPTDIELSNAEVAEDAKLETVIGTLLAIDADENDTHTFELVTDVADNASFTIEGASLKLNTALDFETKETYSIKVKVTDAAGLSFEKELTIQVTDVDEDPTDITTGIVDFDDQELQLYPNPVVNHLKIRCSNIKNVKVFNVIGKLVLATNNDGNQLELDLNFSDLKQGLYLVRIELNNNKVLTKKVVK